VTDLGKTLRTIKVEPLEVPEPLRREVPERREEPVEPERREEPVPAKK
jgi:hypothetical protein